MKFSFFFCAVAPVCVVGCATAVVPEDPEPQSSTPKKDAAAPDAKQGQMQAQDSGTTSPDTGVDDPGTDSGNANCMLMINYGSNNCQTCMQGCCAQDNACVNSQDCVALITCLNGCTPNDQTCVSGCRGQHASGSTLFDGITSCMGSVCKSSCP